jgi:hypothetical protein
MLEVSPAAGVIFSAVVLVDKVSFLETEVPVILQ